MSWLNDAENKRNQIPKPLTYEEKLAVDMAFFKKHKKAVIEFVREIGSKWGSEIEKEGLLSKWVGEGRKFGFYIRPPYIATEDEYGTTEYGTGFVGIRMWNGKARVSVKKGRDGRFEVFLWATDKNNLSESGELYIYLNGLTETFELLNVHGHFYKDYSLRLNYAPKKKRLEDLKPFIAEYWSEGLFHC